MVVSWEKYYSGPFLGRMDCDVTNSRITDAGGVIFGSLAKDKFASHDCTSVDFKSFYDGSYLFCRLSNWDDFF